jgi:pseudomonalisin
MTSNAPRSLPTSALALAPMLVLAGLGAPARAIDFGLGASTVARATGLRQGDAIVGPLVSTQPMHIVVALKLRNIAQLDSAVAAKQTMNPAQFNAAHAPTPAQAQAVAAYLIQAGFKNVKIAPNQLLVSADGNAAAARTAFRTDFSKVQTKEGRAAFANTADAYIPAGLQGSVLSVIGLQTVNVAHTLAMQTQTITGPAVSGHNPIEFSAIYGGTGVPTAAGVTVGIITVGDISQTIVDLDTFTTNNNLPKAVTEIVNTGGTGDDTSGVVEWNLDSQTIVGASGGQVGKIIFYNTPSFLNTNIVADLNTAMVANAAKIINVSLGECETAAQGDGSAAATDQIFKAAVAQGQTFSIATGDSGANECSPFPGTKPSWPASSPYVIAVAGTTLNASATTWNGEIVWNNLPAHGATGGSLSTFEPKPIWQANAISGAMRGVADLAFTGSPFSGANITYYGGNAQVGGTSLSAPIFAGLWARIIAVKGTGVGFAAPHLYQLPAADFHDITFGNNGGSAAGAGYDLASGRGSLILSRAITHIAAAGAK